MSGCLVVAGLAGLLAVVLVGSCVYLSRAVGPFFSDHPVALRSNDTTKEQYMAAVRKLQPLLNPEAPGQTAPTTPGPVSLTADDLNAFVAHDPHFADAKGKCYFTLPNDRLVVDVSTEIPQQTSRTTKNYYFNARVSGEVEISGGAVRVTPLSIESLDGKAFPEWIMKSSFLHGMIEGFNQGFNKSLHNNTDASEAVSRIESTKIANGQLTLVPVGAAIPPAPVATPANR